MKTTPNYNLKKPDETDFVKIEDLNYNADVIDSELKKIDRKSDGKLDKAGGTVENNLVVDKRLYIGGTKKNSISHYDIDGTFAFYCGTLEGYDFLLNGKSVVRIRNDKTVIRNKRIELDGEVKLVSDFHNKQTGVLSKSNWRKHNGKGGLYNESGGYEYHYVFHIKDISEYDYVDITIDPISTKIAREAEICPTVIEQYGFVLIFAMKEPTDDIQITYKILV